MLDTQQIAYFSERGYLIVPGLLTAEETKVLGDVARLDQALASKMLNRKDAEGGTAQLALENNLSDNLYSAIVQCERMVRSMEALLGGEVYHYHHKMSAKKPFEGGAWEWHQDYGYWYNNGCLFPYMASCYIAVDAATKENGCMQVIAGSHDMGRIEHGKVGRADRGEHGARERRAGAHGAGLCGDGARRRPLLPLQHPASLRPEPQSQSALGPHLLLQRRPQRSV